MNRTIPLFGVDFDAVTMPQAVERLYHYIKSPQDACRYVVTANVNHCVALRKHTGFQDAYAGATMRVVDGRPIRLLSRFFPPELPEVITGSDLVPALYEAADSQGGLSTFLLGAMPGVAERAAEQIQSRWPAVKVTGCYSPPFGFEHDEEENKRILDMIREASPDLLIIGLGAPKQELWIHREHANVAARVAVCAGATIDFLAGEKPRAPRWMQKTGLEWLYRTLSEPRRLAGRYLADGFALPLVIMDEIRRRKNR